MSNQGNRAGTQGRDLQIVADSEPGSGPWRPGIVVPAGTAQDNAPATPNSSNYRGDLSNPRNKSADISDSENCATWWTNLPPDCTYKTLLDSMRNVGAVSHSVINPPVGVHGTSAAKVEFFDRASVDRLLAQSKSGHIRGHVRVGGRIPHISLNRIKVAAHSNAVPSDQGNGGRGSRVIQVIGDPLIISQANLESILADPKNRLVYGLECARSFSDSDGSRCVEFRFASYTVQAARAREIFLAQKLKRDLSPRDRARWEGVVCIYAPDPCE
ncbi:hypothetical protein GQX73_g9056 [Xylaria multiplex]|uniref:RRM domain-containing protein n=1 Tax=Xylaria multiplex TaxID=323545 RepID=A0A7C8MN16_9PEZI|nr:hypothetical protein GQX73_g9056 [Xylaria multiplex]